MPLTIVSASTTAERVDALLDGQYGEDWVAAFTPRQEPLSRRQLKSAKWRAARARSRKLRRARARSAGGWISTRAPSHSSTAGRLGRSWRGAGRPESGGSMPRLWWVERPHERPSLTSQPRAQKYWWTNATVKTPWKAQARLAVVAMEDERLKAVCGLRWWERGNSHDCGSSEGMSTTGRSQTQARSSPPNGSSRRIGKNLARGNARLIATSLQSKLVLLTHWHGNLYPGAASGTREVSAVRGTRPEKVQMCSNCDKEGHAVWSRSCPGFKMAYDNFQRLHLGNAFEGTKLRQGSGGRERLVIQASATKLPGHAKIKHQDDERNGHSFTAANLATAQMALLVKDIPTLEAKNTQSWTRPYNIFSTSDFPSHGRIATDQIPIIAELAVEVGRVQCNFKGVGRKEIHNVLGNTLDELSLPEAIRTEMRLEQALEHVMSAIREGHPKAAELKAARVHGDRDHPASRCIFGAKEPVRTKAGVRGRPLLETYLKPSQGCGDHRSARRPPACVKSSSIALIGPDRDVAIEMVKSGGARVQVYTDGLEIERGDRMQRRWRSYSSIWRAAHPGGRVPVGLEAARKMGATAGDDCGRQPSGAETHGCQEDRSCQGLVVDGLARRTTSIVLLRSCAPDTYPCAKLSGNPNRADALLAPMKDEMRRMSPTAQ
ncbi:hypothetical protein BU17DRAFT_62694 [Hysterangium stoloniferum]|nr:hypothetical protein BU17DRAFT_62694 [Hysterangium stoloniferum]